MHSKNKPGRSNTWHSSQETRQTRLWWTRDVNPLDSGGFLDTAPSPKRSPRIHLHLPKYCPAYKPSEKVPDHPNQKPTLHPAHELLSNLASFFRLSAHISLCHGYLYKYQSPCPTPQLYPYFSKHFTTSFIKKRNKKKNYFGGYKFIFSNSFFNIYIFLFNHQSNWSASWSYREAAWMHTVNGLFLRWAAPRHLQSSCS